MQLLSRRILNRFPYGLFIIMMMLPYTFNAQINEFSNWYFGNHAGLTWKVLQPNGDPTRLYDGQISTMEAVATVSDAYGNLLFYTDGSTVFNRQHLPMSNTLPSSPGGKLKGHSSSSTLAVVANPVYNGIYYIFTTGHELDPEGLCYSKLDMNLNNGLGDIDLGEKNICLFTPTTEKVVAIKHSNGIDYWIVTHPWNTNQFYTYLINENGVNATNPVISEIGIIHSGSFVNTIGTIKSNTLGNKIALSITGLNIVEVLQFNNTTGVLENSIEIENQAMNRPYGIEFSPNGSLLYVSEDIPLNANLVQFNICLPSAIDVSNSISIIGLFTNLGDLRIGPDQKIYVARFNSNYLGRIESPNASGTQCQFNLDAILLNSPVDSTIKSQGGLPSTIIASGGSIPSFTYIPCGDTTEFSISNPNGISEIIWNFNYPSTDPQFHKTDSIFSTSFQYPAPGSYYVELKVNRYGYIDSSLQQIFIEFPLEPNLGPDTVLCTDASIAYDFSWLDSCAYNQNASYSWHASIENNDYYSSSPTYSINKPGIYTLTVSGYGICPNGTDQIVVQYNNVVADVGFDTLATQCLSSPVTLDALYSNTDFGPVSYAWNTQQNTPAITPLVTGTYTITVSSGNCQAVQSIEVNYDNPLVSPFPVEYYLCEDSSLTLSALNPGAAYQWSNSAHTQNILINSSGIYQLTVSNACGTLIDTAHVIEINNQPTNLLDTSFKCYHTNLILSVLSNIPNQQYLWSNAETMGFIGVMSPGLYYVTISNQCGDFVDSTLVINEYPLAGFLGEDTLVCPGYQLSSQLPGQTYYWLSGETSEGITITQPGIYYLEITNSCGTFWDETEIGMLAEDFEIDLGNDTTICFGDTLFLSTLSPYNHLWWDSSTITEHPVFNTGIYSVTVFNNCFSHTDSLAVSIAHNDFEFDTDSIFLEEGESEIISISPNYQSYLWSNGQTNFWISIDTPGVYWAETIDNTGCSAMDSIVVVPLIFLPELDLSSLLIYPNPTNGELFIEGLSGQVSMEVYDFLGKKLISLSSAETKQIINLKPYPNGIYYLIIQTSTQHRERWKVVRL